MNRFLDFCVDYLPESLRNFIFFKVITKKQAQRWVEWQLCKKSDRKKTYIEMVKKTKSAIKKD
jgi:hypothetical protein